MKLPVIEPHETQLAYLLRIVATDDLDIAVRQRAANRAVKILRSRERNYDASSVWRLAKIVQPGGRFAPCRPPLGYIAGD
ncbi:MAG: hypothetical protein Q8O52_01665 [Sulfuritalea sp.]|nr:hypothetical protein [Sulfuritalea sp.]